MLAEPGQPLLRPFELEHREVQRLPVEGATQDEDVGAPLNVQLLGHVGRHPGVRRGRGGQHRDAGRQGGDHLADAPVVGPEVVAPVGDAVRLVDDEQAGGLGELGQDLVAERRVVQPLGTDEQDVDLARVDLRADRGPVLDVGRVDGGCADAGALSGLDLVAHQCEQRRDDHRRAGAESAHQGGGDEVDRRLAPAGPLDHEHPALLHHERLDRCPLVVVEPRVVETDQGAEVALGLLAGAGAARCVAGRGHGPCLPRQGDRFTRGIHRRAPRRTHLLGTSPVLTRKPHSRRTTTAPVFVATAMRRSVTATW